MKKIVGLLLLLPFAIHVNAQKHNLGLNLSKGKSYTHHTTSDMNIQQSVNGQDVDIAIFIEGKMSFKVLDVVDGDYKMMAQYDSLKLKMETPNGSMAFTSGSENEKDLLSSFLNKIVGKPFGLTMAKTGKVVEVTGLDSLFLNMLQDTVRISEEQRQQIHEQLNQVYGVDAFKGNLEMVTAIFPDEPVAVNDTWNIQTNLNNNMQAEVETDFKLTAVEADYVVITGSSRLETTEDDASLPQNEVPVKVTFTGVIASDIKVDKKTGWIISSKISQTLNGKTELKPTADMPDGMVIPMTMNTETTISGK